MSEFTEMLHDLFGDFGEVTSKKMFGGYGLFHKGLMFALVADDMLYLKSDAENIEAFRSRELPPFTYLKKGKEIQMSYRLAPEEIFDDAEAAARWANMSYQAAVRSRK